MNGGEARGIDIGIELEAAARGECLACRLGGRHKEGSTCPGAKKWADHWCAKGRHDYPKDVRGGLLVKIGRCRHCGAL